MIALLRAVRHARVESGPRRKMGRNTGA
jgi:hypothetical protein